MSLINDMLKDLDTQRVHRNTASDAALFGLGLSGGAATPTQKGLAVVTAAGLVVLLAVFAWPHAAKILEHQGMQGAAPADNTAHNAPATVAPGTREGRARPTPERAPRSAAVPEKPAKPAAKTKPAKTRAAVLQHRSAPNPAAVAPRPGARSSLIVAHQPTVQERVRQNYQQAVTAFRAGQYSTAEAFLDEGLALDGTSHKTRLLLANLYISQQRSLDAEDLLAKALLNNPGHPDYAQLYAQLLVAQERYTEALQHMQSALPGAARDGRYQATLAGLYQRTGQPVNAARHYQLALQSSPEKGEWWMGLGISLEQAGNTINAYAAYQRALRYPLGAALQKYISTRINSLPRQRNRD